MQTPAIFRYSSLIGFTLICYSCAHFNLTPKNRIEKNQTLYDQKPPQEQRAISNGFISPGMTRDAVYLAWGNPKSRLTGFENGKPFEEWTYEKLGPKLNIQLGVSSGPGVGVDKKYVKSVRFIDGRVASFQQKE